MLQVVNQCSIHETVPSELTLKPKCSLKWPKIHSANHLEFIFTMVQNNLSFSAFTLLVGSSDL